MKEETFGRVGGTVGRPCHNSDCTPHAPREVVPVRPHAEREEDYDSVLARPADRAAAVVPANP